MGTVQQTTNRLTTTGNTGGGEAHNILQPYIVTNYIIKVFQSSGVVATVIDNLNSTSTTDALSANQGKILKDNLEILKTYSTEEVNTGKVWIDNKPIYRKIITLTLTSLSSTVNMDASSLNIETVTHFEGISQSDPISINYTVDLSADRFRTYYNPNNKKIYAQGGSSYPTVPCTVYIIIEYTKTTD